MIAVEGGVAPEPLAGRPPSGQPPSESPRKSADPGSWTSRRGIGTTTFVNLLILGLGLVSSVTSARALGPEGRGIFSIAWAVSGFAAVVVGLGLSQAFTYFVAKDRRAVRKAWTLAVYSGVGLGVPVAALGVLVVDLFVINETQAHALMLGLLALPLAIISNDMTGILQGLQLVSRFNLSRLITPIAFALLLLVWALAGPGGAAGAVAIYVLATGFGMVGSIALAKRYIGGLRHLDRRFAQAALRYGLVVNIGAAAYVTNRFLIVVAVGLVASAADVGLFAVAMGYALPVSLAGTAIAFHTMPEIAGTMNAPAQRRLFRRRASATLKTTAILGVLAIAAAPLLIPLAFGDEFSAAVGVAQVLVGAEAVLAVGFVLEETSRGLGKPAFPALAQSTGLVGTLLAVMLIVPTTGLNGAGLVALMINSIVAAVMYVYLRRHFGTQ